jgi:hypothetical protein
MQIRPPGSLSARGCRACRGRTSGINKYAGRFLEILKPVRSVVYGSPSQEVKDVLADFNPVYMRPVGGFSR